MDVLSPEPMPQEKESPDSEACWALLERLVASPQLRRAARMREFLLFVGQRSLKDGSSQIHEQEIGSEVFGRPAGYDTSVDNIVRVNATDLRKRIEEYFATDGAHESLVLEIPRGSYKPVFHPRAAKPALGPVSIEPRQVKSLQDAPVAGLPTITPLAGAHPPAAQSHRLLLALAGALLVALAISCFLLWTQNQSLRRSLYPWRSTPAVAGFWSGLLSARPNTDVILADTSFALIEDITQAPIPLNEYLNHSYVSRIQSPKLSADRREDLGLIVQRNYGSIGDFRVAQRIGALDPLGSNIHLYAARDFEPSRVKQDNVILIGGRKSNPWVDLFADRLNFSVEYDPKSFVNFVRNRAPVAGEQAVYNSPPAPGPNSGYSVVAYLPNDAGGKVLIVAGTGSEATEGAGEFLTSEDQLAAFQRLLHVSTLPYFEVLLKTTHLNGTPMNATIVAYRTYPGLK
jgi:hypothetical protein